ncbi:LacI family DNA-binding transcriptional regulator [uncultured Dysosmobacter sp.]|uniref:LacI family DNA-binding transcriptional regulator n=1 Tax=uncultured Dysosmobacter sp. TaxID=2591384 RepID=UPI002615F678|nr:LacI family DNA-binding transcriptional regulator [uncultured Dysosmobacter sp.]
MSKRVTIQMVADLAGVSRGTVDRVLNNRSYVRSDVRERVLAALAETGYVSPRDAHLQTLGTALQPLKLGVLLPSGSGAQFQDDIEQGIRYAREELAGSSIQVSVARCKTDIPQEAISLLNSLIEEGAAGLAICAQSDRSIQRRVAELTSSGIPCITFNSDLPDSGRLCFVGQDIRRTGRVAAQLMSKCVPPDALILATVGNLKFDGHRQRLSGFQARLAELGFAPEQLVVAETFNDYGTTVSVVSDAIARYPGLRGVYMANLNVSGCAEAIRAAGRRGQIRVVCHDVNESIRQMLLNGSVDFTIPQDMVRQGELPLLLLRDLLRRGIRPDPVRARGRIDVLCAENLTV